MKYNKGRGYVFLLRYHIIWCVKYRHGILVGEVETRLKEMLDPLADEYGFTIVAMETMPDHVHLLLDCKPRHYIPDLVKALKSVTARNLLKEFPPLRKKLWGGHVWSPSYLVASVSEVSKDIVREYIESQKETDYGREGV